jgi:hypothetical protein
MGPFRLSVASFSLSYDDLANQTFCCETGKRGVEFSWNLVCRSRHWRLVQTCNSYFPTIGNTNVMDTRIYQVRGRSSAITPTTMIMCKDWWHHNSIASDHIIANNCCNFLLEIGWTEFHEICHGWHTTGLLQAKTFKFPAINNINVPTNAQSRKVWGSPVELCANTYK